MARVKPIDDPSPEEEGAPWTADVDLPPVPPLPPPGVKEEALDLVATLVRERALVADDPELKRMAGELLAAGHSVERTSLMLGLRPSTVWSWMGDPLIRQAKRAGVEFVRARICEELMGTTLEAARALGVVVADPLADPETKLRIFEALADRTGFGKPDRKGGGERRVIDVTFSKRLAVVASGAAAIVDEEEAAEDDEEAEDD